MTKEELCHVAKELFFDFGFHSVTMDDLAKKAGVSKKTLYTHFRNKAELIDATVEIFITKIHDVSREILADKSLNAIEQIFRIDDKIAVEMKASNPILLNQLQKYYPLTYEKLRNSLIDDNCDSLYQHYRYGMEQGLFRSDIDSQFAVRLYISIMFEINNNLFLGKEFDQEYLEDQYREYHLRAISTPKGMEVLEKLIEKRNK
ncbi:MAG: TetR/AcrR family transcriptional regulator [Capnocytophaga sp.]|nr:TetR/AcrR family transcriptional regulator [Capnocytophaga sp.]